MYWLFHPVLPRHAVLTLPPSLELSWTLESYNQSCLVKKAWIFHPVLSCQEPDSYIQPCLIMRTQLAALNCHESGLFHIGWSWRPDSSFHPVLSGHEDLTLSSNLNLSHVSAWLHETLPSPKFQTLPLMDPLRTSETAWLRKTLASLPPMHLMRKPRPGTSETGKKFNNIIVISFWLWSPCLT